MSSILLTSKPDHLNIAIVGSGPRGLSVLERIIHHSRESLDLKVTILLFDKKDHGPGCHNLDQSPHLLLNTAADQINIFPKDEEIDQMQPRHTLTFDKWIQECVELGLHSDLITLKNDSPLDTYQPRALFGFYLKDMLASLIETKNQLLEVNLIHSYVQDISKRADGRWDICSSDDVYSGIDFIYLCTGHHLVANEIPDQDESLISNPYPINEKLSKIPDGCTVALRGLGLTAIDIIAQLTLGRGGRFLNEPNRSTLTYLPSGREPKILAFSRSGFPLLPRPNNQKTNIEQRLGKHFTRAAVDHYKRAGKIDFKKYLLPLIVKDMEEAYAAALHRETFENKNYSEKANKKHDTTQESFAPEEHWFFNNPKINAFHDDTLKSSQFFKEYLFRYLKEDLEESEKGNISSPIKAAYDVLRDHRELIAYAMDFAGLEGDSQKWFYDEFLPKMKRYSVGPPKERIQQLIALQASGILAMDFGPNSRCIKSEKGWKVISGLTSDYTCNADFLVDGVLPINGPGDDPLLKKLVAKGIAKYFENGSYKSDGLDINRNLNVLDQKGEPNSSMWALGVTTEGARFYTFFLPRPYGRSRFEEDAETAVRTMFEQIVKTEEV